MTSPLNARPRVVKSKVLSSNPEQRVTHSEHAVRARTTHALTLYSATILAPILVELREREPGYLQSVEGGTPPQVIGMETPETGEVVCTWRRTSASGRRSFGEPDSDELSVGNTGQLAHINS